MVSTEIQPVLASPNTRRSLWRSTKLRVLLGLFIAFILFAGFAGRMLVNDHPQKSDVIVVLAGDSQDARYRHGMELLRAGYGKHLLLDASSDSSYYGRTPAEYADAFLKQDAKDMAGQVSVCPFEDDSTDTEQNMLRAAWRRFIPQACSWLPVTGTRLGPAPSLPAGCRNIIGQPQQRMTTGSLASIGGTTASGPKQPSRNGSR